MVIFCNCQPHHRFKPYLNLKEHKCHRPYDTFHDIKIKAYAIMMLVIKIELSDIVSFK